MNYQRIYDQLITKRRSITPEGYKEQHHIIPRSMGGTDEAENLVGLSLPEHFFAHLLLTKIHGGTQCLSLQAFTQTTIVERIKWRKNKRIPKWALRRISIETNNCRNILRRRMTDHISRGILRSINT